MFRVPYTSGTEIHDMAEDNDMRPDVTEELARLLPPLISPPSSIQNNNQADTHPTPT